MRRTTTALLTASLLAAIAAPAAAAPANEQISGDARLELRIMFETVVELEDGSCAYTGLVRTGSGQLTGPDGDASVFVPGRTVVDAVGSCDVDLGRAAMRGQARVDALLRRNGRAELTAGEGRFVASDPDNGDAYLTITMCNC